MMQIIQRSFYVGFIAMASYVSAAEVSVKKIVVSKHEASGLTIVGGEVTLPGKGEWYTANQLPDNAAFSQVMIEPPEEVLQALLGSRGRAVQDARVEQDHKRALRGAYWSLSRWAKKHDGKMPLLEELAKENRPSVNAALNALPIVSSDLLEIPEAPHAELVPDAIFEFKKPNDGKNDYSWPTNTAPILVELHPRVDDGKHYVLRANNRLERVEIDQALMDRLDLTVSPLKLNPAAGRYPKEATYRVMAKRRHSGSTTLTLTNDTTRATASIVFPDTTSMEASDPESLKEWYWRRQEDWGYLAEQFDAPGLRTWAWIQEGLQSGEWELPQTRRSRRGAQATTDMMGVLGGRAALRETLQLEALRLNSTTNTVSVPLDSVAGVEVKSHPFDEMLAGSDGGKYAIANYVPYDRFFVGISKPDALMPLLDDGAAFLSRIGAGATGRAIHYGLKDRYLQALGINEPIVRALLKSKAIDEVALFSPDLFYIDGTDVTVLARMHGEGLKMLFSLVGNSLKADELMSVKTADGSEAWWVLVDDLVVIGTNQKEVQSVVNLTRKDGKGSLGRSDEFRFMLTKVPHTEQTRAYVYFSDPFIRRLVGPEVKIGQVRRLQEKARMQALAYASMLYSHDVFKTARSVDQLITAGYFPSVNMEDLRFDDGVPFSATYGSLPKLDSIYAADLSMLTKEEENTYTAYKENYSRYWRRFFDPIAMRIEEDDNELVATTYILPLLDNSLYDDVRDVVNADPSIPLLIPQLLPMATAMVSLNLSEKAWGEMFKDGFFQMASQMGADMAALDQLGPSFHFALFDSDPIIAFGSRSLLGMGGEFGDFDEEMMIPLFVSLLTRPCAIIIELQDPEPVRTFFKHGGLKNMFAEMGSEVKLSSYRIAGTDSWVGGIDFFGLSLRFSFAIEGDYLIVGNMPWRKPIKVVGQTLSSVAGAAVQVNPAAAKIEHRALHLSAMEGERQATMEGLAYLYPLLAAGIPPEEAIAQHRKLFGFEPKLPPGQMPKWDGLVPSCSGFGDLYTQEQPAYDPDAFFGALHGVDQASAAMQFEDTGLRTVMRWKFRKEK